MTLAIEPMPLPSASGRRIVAGARTGESGGLRERRVSVASTTVEGGLERNAIGLTELLFQSITHMAPAVATALSIGAATAFAGGITPLAVVFAMIAVLFTAYSMRDRKSTRLNSSH